MRIETIHEMGADYLKISEVDWQEKISMIQMLQHNEIKGILLPNSRMIDGEVSYYYEINGLQALIRYLKSNRFGKEELIRMFRNMCNIYDFARNYLIEDYEILQTPESLFIDRNEEVYMPFLPLEEEANQNIKGVIKIIETIMTYMDHADQELIFFVYELYKRCREESVRVCNLKKILSETEENTKKKEVSPRMYAIPKMQREGVMSGEVERMGKVSDGSKKSENITLDSDHKEEGDLKRKWLLMGGFLVLGGILTGFVLLSRLLRYEISGGYDRVKVMVYIVVVFLLESYAASKLFHMEESKNRIPEFIKNKTKEESQTVLLCTETKQKAIVLKAMEEPWKDIVVDRFPFRVGKRKEHVDGIVEREGVSRLHGEFICEESEVLFRDMGSTNGTYLNNEELVSHQFVPVREGDILQFGIAAFRIMC